MMREIFKIKSTIYLFVLSMCLISCSEKTEYTVLTGDLIGYISLKDKNKNSIDDKSNIVVTVENTVPEIRVLTDFDGKFIIKDLESGTYNLTFNKEGFYQHKNNGVQFVGGNKPSILNRFIMYEKIDLGIDSIKISNEYQLVSLDYAIQAWLNNYEDSEYNDCIIYFSNKPSVSYNNYMSFAISGMYNDSVAKYQYRIDTMLYPVGTELYMIMYTAANYYNSYIDISTGMEIFTSVNVDKPSDILNLTVPSFGYNNWK